MKAIIEFDRNDPADFKALKRAMQANEAFGALWEIKNRVIPEMWDKAVSADHQIILEEIVDEIHQVIDAFCVDVELAG